MSSNSSNSSNGDLGNTKTKSQDTAAKRWCFTLNNYTKEEVDELNSYFSSNSSYIMAKEVGEGGTRHLQGYVEMKSKIRFTALKKVNSRLHLEKAKKNRLINITYCTKDIGDKYGDLVPEVVFCEKPVAKLDFLYNKMQEYEFPKGDRKINVVVDKIGGIGKTEFCRYCVMNLDRCIVTGGKAADMKHQIVEFIAKTGKTPKYVLIDVPRASQGYISYTGIEEIKNMLFYSGKYEGGMVNGNKPCVVMFMNEDPDETMMSADRWNIYRLNKLKIVGRFIDSDSE